jgi:cytochrome c oxidase assembly factor CtaG
VAHPGPGSAAAGAGAVGRLDAGTGARIEEPGLVGALGWTLAPDVLLPLAAITLLYVVGWWRLAARRRRQAGGRRAGRRWRPAAGLAALAGAGIALMSPLAALAHHLFVAHMAQHMLLIAVVAPLLLLSDPFPAALWALPRSARRVAGRLLVGGSAIRVLWERLTSIPVAGVVYAGVLWLWHHPAAYDAALGGEWLHHLEHLTFFGAALLFWWPVIGPAPRAPRPPSHGLRIGHVLVAALQTSLLALVLSVYPRAIYESYARAARVSSLLPLEDQAWGGIVMWAGGAAVDMLALLILVWRFLAASERAPGDGADTLRPVA